VPGLTACSLCSGETLGDTGGDQIRRLRAIADRGTARLTLTECLDRCERGDVVVARPSPAGRRQGGRPVWFERLAGEEPTTTLAGWLRSGGPGVTPLPEELAGHRIADDPADQPADEPSPASVPPPGMAAGA
jgi:(2Fe-2S) ferredoxin